MQNGKQVAAGVAIGYLLGRTKKMKLALMLGAAAMGSRLDLKSLAGKGAALLEASPGAQRLTSEVRGKLGDSGRAAAVALAGKGMDAFSDKLQSRAERLRSGGSDEAEEPDADETDEPEADEADEPEAEAEEPDEPEAEAEAEEQPKPRRRKNSGGSSGGGGRASKRTSGTRKRASGTAKRASGTRQRRSRTNG